MNSRVLDFKFPNCEIRSLRKFRLAPDGMEEFQHYKAINSQLKKKFVLRKPDLNETKEQFNELSKELKSFKSYSGLCSLAAGNWRAFRPLLSQCI